MVFSKSGLQRRQIVAGEALDCNNLVTLNLDGKQKTGTNCLAVDKNRTGATNAVLAREMGSSLAEVAPNAIRQRSTRLDVGTDGLAV
jgi:hypothetical protein